MKFINSMFSALIPFNETKCGTPESGLFQAQCGCCDNLCIIGGRSFVSFTKRGLVLFLNYMLKIIGVKVLRFLKLYIT